MLTSDSAASDGDDGDIGNDDDRAAPDARRLCGEVGVLVHESDPGSEDVERDLEA